MPTTRVLPDLSGSATVGTDLLPPHVLQVQWESIMTNLIGGGWTLLYELGPGVQLKSICRRISEEVSKTFINIEV